MGGGGYPAGMPERIGSYPVLGQLGRGGMGVVYRARDHRLERDVAIKVLPPEMDEDPRWRQRLQQEAKLLASINHPNIATIFSFEEAGDGHFISMELVEGELLSSMLSHEPLDVREVLSIGQQVASALEAAHRKGVIHRDLKPHNIMVTTENRVKVLDFGLARWIHAQTQITSAGLAVGTLGYMSPEQLRAEAVDHRADVWAFGCILYECLTAKHAFPGVTASERIATSLEREPDWSALPPDLPGRVQDLIRRCLVKNPEARLGVITWARRELQEELAGRASQISTIPDVGSIDTPSNLPLPLTSFIGRDREIRDVSARLAENRLVTLTGSGGCGKSRLAIEVGRQILSRFPEGVWFVELAPLSDPTLVRQAIASALGLKDQPGRSLMETILEFIGDKRLLIILDNCEHLLDEVTRLAQKMFRVGAGVRILATSLESMGITGEVAFRLGAMAAPPASGVLDVTRLQESEAVRLFVDRAATTSPSFTFTEANAAAVASICRRLDGIPLALELAAARVKVLPVAEVANRLDDRFRLLTAGARTSLPHHRTLRALIDWSYDQLESSEQTLLRRLSVFAGGWTLEAAESVCADDALESWEVLDLLSRLVDKSLVEVVIGSESSEGDSRYRMLETVRQYAREQLESAGEQAEASRRHREYFGELVATAAEDLHGSDQAAALTIIDADHDNVNAAFETSLRDEPDLRTALRLTGALSRHWEVRGHWHEGRQRCEELLAIESVRTTSNLDLGKVLNCAGNMALAQADFEASRAFHAESERVFRAIDDLNGLAGALNNQGLVAIRQGEYDTAVPFFEQALVLNCQLGNALREAANYVNLGLISMEKGRNEDSRDHMQRALVLAREVGDDYLIAACLDNLAIVSYELGERTQARAYHEESLEIDRCIGNRRGVAVSLTNLGTLVQDEGDLERARALFEEGLIIKRELGDRMSIAYSLEAMAGLAVALEQPERAVGLLAAALGIRAELGRKVAPAEQSLFDKQLTKLRSDLGDEMFEVEWARGRGMTLDDAVAVALREEGSNHTSKFETR